MLALFVSPLGALSGRGAPNGGQQICSQEYISVLSAAGIDIKIYEFAIDRSIGARVRRRLFPEPYENILPADLAPKLAREITTHGYEVVFLNLVSLAPLAEELRSLVGGRVCIILLSHGLHTTDLLHEVRLRSIDDGKSRASNRDMRWLSWHMTKEMQQRKFIDHVISLSEFETGIEQWLGAKSASWLPRVVPRSSIDWNPTDGRVGFVGTLDHPPNREGILLLLRELERLEDRARIRVRIVGGPEALGRELASTFSTVDYLGPLDNARLEAEAESWALAVHPLFCYARGCSTKLAILLGWQIPVLTTAAGHRGYSWTDGRMPVASGPDQMAQICVEAATVSPVRLLMRDEVCKIVRSSPSVASLGEMARLQLEHLWR